MLATNSPQKEYLLKVVEKNVLVHAYLFCGPSGIGKTELLVDFVCRVNKISNKDIVRNNQHPDVVLVKPLIEEKNGKIRKKDIGIDQVKDAMEKVQYYSYQSKFKFVVIFDAENMTNAASNSILKFMEEPAKDTMICLIANNEERVLPTIRSRCQSIRFGLQPFENIIDELKIKFPQKQTGDIEKCAKLSHGRINFAIKYCEDQELIGKVENHQNIFRKALRGGILEGLALSDKLNKDQNNLLKIMDEWVWFLRSFTRELIQKKEDPRIIKKVFHILLSTVKLKSTIEYENTNTKIQLDNFFIQLS